MAWCDLDWVNMDWTRVLSEKNHLEPQEIQEAEGEQVLVGEEQFSDKGNAAVKERKSIFDKWSEKLKDFLDNAE